MGTKPYEVLRAFTVVLLMSLCCACGSADNAETANQTPTKVALAPVVQDDISTYIQATGSISPRAETFIGPKVNGRIEAFFADEGDFVEKGDPLVRLEQIRFTLDLKQARAAHEENTANLKNLKRTLKRKNELFEKDVIDKQVIDDLQTQVELARARADMSASRLATAGVNLQDSVLYAPFSGFVVERRMNRGEMYAARSNEYVFHLVDTSVVEVEVDIFETKKRFVSVGEAVSVTVDAFAEKNFSGTITVVNPLIDPASRKFLVKIEVTNPDYLLEPGMFARVAITEHTTEKAVLVPARAVLERDGKKVVFTVEEARARKRPVSIGLSTYRRVEITEGVSPGEQVIVDGLYAVKDNAPVTVRAEQSAPPEQTYADTANPPGRGGPAPAQP